MTTILFFLFTFFLLGVSIFFHELGHALYMKKYGIKIEKFSIGIPFPLRIRFQTKKFLGGTCVQITPLLIGAYVKPDKGSEERVKNLPYSENADICGAGPLASILCGLGMVVVSIVLMPEIALKHVVAVGISLFVFTILFLTRKIFMRYLAPVVGMVMLATLVYSIVSVVQVDRENHEYVVGKIEEKIAATDDVEEKERLLQELRMKKNEVKVGEGPIGIFKMFTEVNSFSKSFSLMTFISISLGLFNLLPVLPLDGGRIIGGLVRKIFGKKVEMYYATATGLLFFVFFLYIFYSDIFIG